MENFTLHTPTKIYFGRGRTDETGAIVRGTGAGKVLVCYGGGSAVRTGLLARIERSLTGAGVDYAVLGGVRPNPTAEFSACTARFARENGCDMLLAVGGGSVIDSVKMAAYCVDTGFEPWDITMKRVVPTGRVPVGVVLTIAATGSETSDSAVLTHEGLKRGFSSDLNRPDFAVMDPELTFTLPAYQTACGTVDIMMHTLERYFSLGGDTPLTDRIAEGLLKTVIEAGKVADKEPDNYEARASLMWAGSLSHNGLTGLGRDFFMQVHQLEHELSGMYPRIAHGAGLSALWPSWARYVCAGDVNRFARYAVNVWNIILARTYYKSIPLELHEAAALDGASELQYFFRILIPVCKPIIAVLVLYQFVGMWNSYFDAMIYLEDQSLQPLQLVIRSILVQNTSRPGMVADAQNAAMMAKIAEQLKYSTIVVSSLPLLVMYPFFQKYFEKGVMLGSVKG